jgi:hypothetical protein
VSPESGVNPELVQSARRMRTWNASSSHSMPRTSLPVWLARAATRLEWLDALG